MPPAASGGSKSHSRRRVAPSSAPSEVPASAPVRLHFVPSESTQTRLWAQMLTASDVAFYTRFGMPPRNEWPCTQHEPVIDYRPYTLHARLKSLDYCHACEGVRPHRWHVDALACHVCGYKQ